MRNELLNANIIKVWGSGSDELIEGSFCIVLVSEVFLLQEVIKVNVALLSIHYCSLFKFISTLPIFKRLLQQCETIVTGYQLCVIADLQGNFEYQSEDDSECDSISTSSQINETFENRYEVEHKSLIQTPTKVPSFRREKIVQTILSRSINYAFLIRQPLAYTNNILLIVSVALAFYYIAKSNSSSSPLAMGANGALVLNFEKHLSEFATKFRNFTEDELRLLFHVGRQWLLMQQESPIVLIVAGEESELIVRALSEIFCAAFHISSPVLVIDLTSESVREKLHEGLDRAVHSTVPLAILNGVDHLGWDSPLILHAFADDSSLTTSRALLLLTMKKNFHVSKEQCEKSVME
ncbi:hypothetical protein RB195_024547 [Necator americanus]|uniref:Uncharacterized protein n=1 Tax=Necator americanus TaxID=51031 RepID=A0ABR1ENM8_NECAM